MFYPKTPTFQPGALCVCVFLFRVCALSPRPTRPSVDGELEDSDTPCVATLPSTFRLERTNLVVTAPSTEQSLSVDSLLDALRAALADAGVDVLDLKPAHCVVSGIAAAA